MHRQDLDYFFKSQYFKCHYKNYVKWIINIYLFVYSFAVIAPSCAVEAAVYSEKYQQPPLHTTFLSPNNWQALLGDTVEHLASKQSDVSWPRMELEEQNCFTFITLREQDSRKDANYALPLCHG